MTVVRMLLAVWAAVVGLRAGDREPAPGGRGLLASRPGRSGSVGSDAVRRGSARSGSVGWTPVAPPPAGPARAASSGSADVRSGGAPAASAVPSSGSTPAAGRATGPSAAGSTVGSPVVDRAEPSIPPTPQSRAVRVARAVLIGAGAVLIGVGFGLVAAGVPAGQWGGIAAWLAGALVLHDAVLAPLLLVGNRLLRRAGGAALPWGAVAVVQVAMVVGGAVTLLAFPALRAQAIGARNPSVLPFDYGAHLAVAWALVGVVVVAAVVAGRVRLRGSVSRGPGR